MEEMSLTSASEFNNLGAGIGAGGFGGFGGSMGGFGLVGLVGLKDLFDRDRKGDDNCAKEIATLAAISNLKDVTIAETRAIDMAICDVKANVKDALYATAIQAERNTNDIKTQAQAFQIANDRKFDLLFAQVAKASQDIINVGGLMVGSSNTANPTNIK